MRKKGFIFILATVLMLTLVYLAVVNVDSKQQVTKQFNTLLAEKKVLTAYDDISEGIKAAYGVEFFKNGVNLSISDEMPSTYNITQAIQGYSDFATKYYQTQDLNVSFYPSLVQAAPTFTIYPFGLLYTYPSGWSKNSVALLSTAQNFSFIKNLTLYINATDYHFNQSFSGACSGPSSDWNDYNTCAVGTKYCLFLDLIIVDANGTIFHNGCTPLKLDEGNELDIALSNYTNTATLQLLFGKIDKKIQNNDVYALNVLSGGDKGSGNPFFAVNSTTTFNTSDFSLPAANNLSITDLGSEVQKTWPLDINTNN